MIKATQTLFFKIPFYVYPAFYNSFNSNKKKKDQNPHFENNEPFDVTRNSLDLIDKKTTNNKHKKKQISSNFYTHKNVWCVCTKTSAIKHFFFFNWLDR